jgi:CO/xanthine dehydrogenase Mo-binding subunit
MTRRRLLQTGAISGITITVNSLPFSQSLAETGHIPSTSPVQPRKFDDTWKGQPGLARARIEGLAKVTGQKIYARDFRAKDLPLWPKNEVSVFILRATRVDRIYKSLNFTKLPEDARPYHVITADNLAKDHIQTPWFYPGPLLAATNKAPEYLGQAVALLFFEDHKTYRKALPFLVNSEPYINYGKQVPIPEPKLYGYTRFVRYAESQGKDLFSTVQDGAVQPPWQPADPAGSANARAVYYGEKINAELAKNDWSVFAETFHTPSCDPMFMEGEAGLGYFDDKRNRLELVMGTQSPHDDAEFSAVLYSDQKCPHRIDHIEVHSCYPGGGFGGRDHSIFSMYLALAAVYAQGRPVRLSQSRVEQFQSGIKRHATKIKETLAIDKNGKFQAMKCDMTLNGGGKNNFSFAVAAVGAHNAPGAYYFPRSDIHSKAEATTGVTAGSMRGFGTLQSMFALECLIDEAAETLEIDPIQLRLNNLMTAEHSMITGAKPKGAVRSKEILEQMAQHPLWRKRQSQKPKDDQTLYGVGAALALKTFGTAIGDAVLAKVNIDKRGRIRLMSNGIDMGNGSATSFAVAVAKYLGANASDLKMGVTSDFDILGLVTSMPKDQQDLDEKAKNPFWTPIISMPTAASTSAFNQMHGVLQAAKLVFEEGLFPAAQKIWGAKASRLTPDQARWDNSQLYVEGFPKLDLAQLAAEAHAQGLVVGACTHAYFMGQWASAKFKIRNELRQLPLDGLAVQYAGKKDFAVLTRSDIKYPPISNNHRKGVQTYTPCGALVAVEVNRTSGDVKVVEVQHFIDPGPVIVKENVEGQSQGAIAMAIGHALLEELPQAAGGPGQGGWNLHRYQVAKAADIPLTNQTLHILPPLSADDPAKGIAEVLMIPVMPAVINAIAAATGKRFRSLPVSPDKIKEVLA